MKLRLNVSELVLETRYPERVISPTMNNLNLEPNTCRHVIGNIKISYMGKIRGTLTRRVSLHVQYDFLTANF